MASARGVAVSSRAVCKGCCWANGVCEWAGRGGRRRPSLVAVYLVASLSICRLRVSGNTHACCARLKGEDLFMCFGAISFWRECRPCFSHHCMWYSRTCRSLLHQSSAGRGGIAAHAPSRCVLVPFMPQSRGWLSRGDWSCCLASWREANAMWLRAVSCRVLYFIFVLRTIYFWAPSLRR